MYLNITLEADDFNIALQMKKMLTITQRKFTFSVTQKCVFKYFLIIFQNILAIQSTQKAEYAIVQYFS